MAELDTLKLWTDWDQDPALTAGEISDILDRHAIATTWVTATAYVYGDRVAPATPTGRIFKCVEPGTTGGTEPTWPETYSGQVVDGTVTWEEDGPLPETLYNLRAAAYEAWTIKAGKAAKMFTFGSDGQSFNRSDINKHCMEMAAQYAPYRMA